MRKLALSLAVVVATAGAAYAQSPTNFADVDTDANGELSFAELQIVWPDLTQEEFDGADADKSGGLIAAELNTLQPSAIPAAPAAPDAAAPAGAVTQ